MVFSDPSQPISSNVLLYQIFQEELLTFQILGESGRHHKSLNSLKKRGVGSYSENYLSYVQKEKKSRSSDSTGQKQIQMDTTLHLREGGTMSLEVTVSK